MVRTAWRGPQLQIREPANLPSDVQLFWRKPAECVENAMQVRISGVTAGSLPSPRPAAATSPATSGAAASAPAAAPSPARAGTGCSITSGAASGGGGSQSLAAYDSEVGSKLDAFVAAAQPLGGDISKPSAVVKAAFDGQRRIVDAIASKHSVSLLLKSSQSVTSMLTSAVYGPPHGGCWQSSSDSLQACAPPSRPGAGLA